MVYLFGFGLLIIGYTLIDWGVSRVAHKNTSMWYLLSGQGSAPAAATKQASADVAPRVFSV